MDPRLISGTVANMAVYFALLEPGDIMTSVALSHGAHISSAKFGAAGMRGVNNVNYPLDRKSTRLNSSHSQISYAVFCLKKKNIYNHDILTRQSSHLKTYQAPYAD